MHDLPIAPPLTYDSYSSSSTVYNCIQPSNTTTMFTSELASTNFKRYASGDRDGDLHDPVRQTKQQRRLSPTSSLHPTIMTRPRWETTDEYALADDDDEQEIVSYANYWEDRWGQQTRSKPQRPHSISSYNYTPSAASTSQHRHSFNYWGCSSHSPDSDNTVLSDSEDYEYDDDATVATKKTHRRVSKIFSRAVRRQRHASDPMVGTSASTAIEVSPTPAYSAPPAITINNDPFLDSYPQHHPITPSRSSRSRASRRSVDGAYSLPSSPRYRTASLLEQEEEDMVRTNSHVEDEEEEEEAQPEYVPTCSDAIRRQWQAIALRIQFGVFRAQKRFKGKSARVKTRLGLTSQSS